MVIYLAAAQYPNSRPGRSPKYLVIAYQVEKANQSRVWFCFQLFYGLYMIMENERVNGICETHLRNINFLTYQFMNLQKDASVWRN